MPPEITRERVNFAMNRKVKWRQLTKRKDEFGRDYIIWVDRNNLEPVGQIERHFTAPVTIPDEYLRYPEDKPWFVDTLWIAYATYLKQELQRWQRDVRAHMKRLYGALGVERAAAAPTPQALEAAGPPPQDWRLVMLMMRGDPWCLGFQRNRTPAVVAVIGKEEDEGTAEEKELKIKSLELDPELEALVGKGGQAARRIDPRAQTPNRTHVAGKSPSAAPGPKGGAKGKGRGKPADDEPEEPEFREPAGADDDEEEDILTGSADLDDDELGSLELSDADLDDLSTKHDPTGLGGKNVPVGTQRPRKPRGEGKG